jgi:hypothetical protein
VAGILGQKLDHAQCSMYLTPNHTVLCPSNGSAHQLRRDQPTGEMLWTVRSSIPAHKCNDLPLKPRAVCCMRLLGCVAPDISRIVNVTAQHADKEPCHTVEHQA